MLALRYNKLVDTKTVVKEYSLFSTLIPKSQVLHRDERWESNQTRALEISSKQTPHARFYSGASSQDTNHKRRVRMGNFWFEKECQMLLIQ